MVMMWWGGQLQPISSDMEWFFCSKATAQTILEKHVIPLCPNATIADETKIQSIKFIVDPNDDIRFWEINGVINPDSGNPLTVAENAGYLTARQKDRSIAAGGNIDHQHGDDLVIRSSTFGLANLGWGA